MKTTLDATRAPICDENAEHGPMKQEHIYKLDGSIDDRYGLYWFCQVKDCDGYGGPVKVKAERKPQATQAEQLSMFGEPA